MASSRHLKGTVLTRVRDLLKSGVLKEKPVWYDVVATFPPLVQADLDRKPERGSVKKITFPEDLKDGLEKPASSTVVDQQEVWASRMKEQE